MNMAYLYEEQDEKRENWINLFYRAKHQQKKSE